MTRYAHERRKEKKMTHRIWLALLLAITAITAGCNTMEGAGKDIERGWEKIQQKAQ
jgi:predicted small secreted protein